MALLGIFAIVAAAFLVRPYDAARLRDGGRALSFVDRRGEPLGTLLAADERHAVAVPLARISPNFLRALIAVEDRRFFAHGAVDGLALLRALTQVPRERRLPHGASTVSMQLARLLEPAPAGFFGQMHEVLVAQRLENALAKDAILEAYANRVPMGSNVYGVEAAAQTYFGIPASDLDLAQASLLAALPNDPVALDPYAHFSALKRRQQAVLRAMVGSAYISQAGAATAGREHLSLERRGGGLIAAPHYLFALARTAPSGASVVQTAIDLSLQRFAEAQTRDVIATLASRNVRNAAAIVIENRTGAIRAYVGSQDYFDDAALGRNDGVQALRQPGSTLKPFLYALALERGVLRSNSIVLDSPVAYAIPGGKLYEPADYSQRYLGPVLVRTALADSLNVPAVRVLANVGVGDFLDQLHALGFRHLHRDASYYGLGLALGGGEVTLEELARAYASLANSASPQDRLVTDMLADRHARAAAFGVDSILALPFAAAVKTGTSSGHRDTWTVGFSRDYTVASWVGNFDGSPMRGVSGVTGAAPLWARLMLHLHEEREPLAFEPPAGYEHAELCANTGSPATGSCNTVQEYVHVDDPAKAPTRAAAVGARRQAGAPAPFAITFPREDDRFVYFAQTHQRLRLSFAGAVRRVIVDGRPLQRSGDAFVWTVQPGHHVLRATDGVAWSSVRFDAGSPLAALHRGFTTARL